MKNSNRTLTKFSWRNVLVLLVISFLLLTAVYFIYVFVYPPVSCLIKGDKWTKTGKRAYTCLHTYPDGGKPCTSSQECEGSCQVGHRGQPDYCEYDNNPFGCYSLVEDCREVEGERICQMICVD